MEQMAFYLLKSMLYLGIFTGIYWVFFRQETFYRFNRYFLLAGLITAAVLPFYTYTYQLSVPVLSDTIVVATKDMGAKKIGLSWSEILLSTYAMICLLILSYKFIVLWRLKHNLDKQGYESVDGYKLLRSKTFQSSFSLFNYIVISDQPDRSPLEEQLILVHEKAHVQQSHWVDLLLTQLFCALYWWNPLALFYQRLIKDNHEFLADAAVLEAGNSPVVYKATLINHTLGIPVFSLASSFSHQDQMSRVKMMMRPKSAGLNKLALLVLFPVLFLVVWFFAKPEYVQAKASADSLVPLNQGEILGLEKEMYVNKAKSAPIGVELSNSRLRPKARKLKVAVSQEAQTQPLIPAIDSAVKVQTQPQNLFANRNPVPLYLLDGQPINSIHHIPAETIESIHVYKGPMAIELYGEDGKNGVVVVLSKKASKDNF